MPTPGARGPDAGLSEDLRREIAAQVVAALGSEGVKSALRSRTIAGLAIAYAGLHAEPLLASLAFVTDPAELAREIVTIGLALAGYGRLMARRGLR